MKKCGYLFLVLAFVLNGEWGFSQDVFVFYNRYNKETQEELLKNKFKPIEIITVGNIDPKRTNKVDENKVKTFLSNNFSKNEIHYLVIDWEEKGYKDLRQKQQRTAQYKEAEKQFLTVVKLIREYNPKIKIGIYGLPSRLPTGKKANINQRKFDRLFSKIDFISPSLYTMSPIKEVGEKANNSYLEENLKQVLSYSNRLNKPVIPFVWELVHPDNKSYGKTLLSDDEFFSNVQKVSNYKYNGKSVEGVIWWAPGTAFSVYQQRKPLAESSSSVRSTNATSSDHRSEYIKERVNRIKAVTSK